jgi:YD repeat-containing protein
VNETGIDTVTGIPSQASQDGTVAYTHDKTSQITGADYSYQTDETFAWDASGGSNTVGTNNRLTSDGTYNYTYDDEGNLTRKTKISDGSYTDYTWEYRNRLTSVVNNTSGGTVTMSADYAYELTSAMWYSPVAVFVVINLASAALSYWLLRSPRSLTRRPNATGR